MGDFTNQDEDLQLKLKRLQHDPEFWNIVRQMNEFSGAITEEVARKLTEPGERLPEIARARPILREELKERAEPERLIELPPWFPTSNLSIAGIERTQATQFFRFNNQGSGNAADNTVPLVAKKDLILRVYVNVANFPWLPHPGSVTGVVTYAGRPNLSPLNGPLPPGPSSAINRGNTNHTLNFRVPAAHCTGTVVFSVRVFDPAHPNQPTYSSRTVTVSATFDGVPNVRIHGVLIHYIGRGMNIAAPSGLDLVNTLVWVGRTYPISGFNYTACEAVDFAGDLTVGGGGGCGVGWNQLFNMLWNMRAASGTTDVYVGLLPPGVPTSGVIGCGGGGVAIAYKDGGTVLAQEIGHAFGRAHAPCGNPGGPDPNYPTYNSYPSGSIGEFGFDSATLQVFDPASTFDFMSYCGPVWVSPYTYVNLKNAITASPAAAHPERAGGRSRPGEYLYLNYRMYRDGTVTLLPSFHLAGPGPMPEVGPVSEVSCDLLGPNGEVLETHRCHHLDVDHDPDATVYMDFHESIPWSPEVKAIAFRRGDKMCHTLDLGKDEPPKIKIRSPKRLARRQELLGLEWEADQATESTRYVVRYSADKGATWRAVAADLAEPRCVMNLDLLPGGDQCVLQVIASSGIRTTIETSEPFEVPVKPMKAHILSPQPGATLEQGEPIILVGGGFSPDFGTAEFDDVLWASNLDGVLGAGYQLVVSNLRPGRHKLTVSMSDHTGGEAVSSVYVDVK